MARRSRLGRAKFIGALVLVGRVEVVRLRAAEDAEERRDLGRDLRREDAALVRLLDVGEDRRAERDGTIQVVVAG